MFTPFDSHLPVVAKTGLAHVSNVTRGWTQANAALVRRMAPC
jgi:hypothetical protein